MRLAAGGELAWIMAVTGVPGKPPSSNAPKLGRDIGQILMRRIRTAAHIELHGSWHTDHTLRAIAGLESCIFERLGPIDEKAAAQSFLILNYPAAMAVSSNVKNGIRGRLVLVHGGTNVF
jgi:hypothetical protein